MTNENVKVIRGVVRAIERTNIRVELDLTNTSGKKDIKGPIILTHITGKMRHSRIRIVVGDIVQVSINTSSPDKGIITYRGEGRQYNNPTVNPTTTIVTPETTV